MTTTKGMTFADLLTQQDRVKRSMPFSWSI